MRPTGTDILWGIPMQGTAEDGPFLAKAMTFFLGLVVPPTIIYFLITLALPESSESPVTTVALYFLIFILALIMVTLGSLFLPKQEIETFKSRNDCYRIPQRLVLRYVGPFFYIVMIILSAAATFAPVFLILLMKGIYFKGISPLFPILESFTFENMLQSLQVAVDLPAIVIFTLWCAIAIRFVPTLWRKMQKPIRMAHEPYLVLDSYGISSPFNEISVPWAVVTSVEVRDFTYLVLKGGTDLENLKPTLPKFMPSEFKEALAVDGMVINVAMLPIYVGELASVIRARISSNR